MAVIESLRRLGAALKTRPAYGYVVAGGLVIGLLLVIGVGNLDRISGHRGGDTIRGSSLPAPTAAGSVDGRLKADVADASCTVQVKLGDDGAVLRCEPEGTAAFRIRVESAVDLEYRNTQYGETREYSPHVEMVRGRIVFDGSRFWEVEIADADGSGPESISVTILKDGVVLAEENFSKP